jgi:hypothetical protein
MKIGFFFGVIVARSHPIHYIHKHTHTFLSFHLALKDVLKFWILFSFVVVAYTSLALMIKKKRKPQGR